jgi:hypothetical protein
MLGFYEARSCYAAWASLKLTIRFLTAGITGWVLPHAENIEAFQKPQVYLIVPEFIYWAWSPMGCPDNIITV